MSACLVYLSLMGLTVSYRHAWRRDLSSGLGLPFPRMMARRPCHLERDFDWLQGWPMPTRENQQIICCLCSPLFPRYQHMMISRQNRIGKRFIHIPSPPDIMSLAGNCILCADILSDIFPAWHHVVDGELHFMCRSFLQYIPGAQLRLPDPRKRTSDWGRHTLSFRPTRPATVSSQRPHYP